MTGSMPRKARISRRTRRRRAAVGTLAGHLIRGCRAAVPWVLLLAIVIGLPTAADVGWKRVLRSEFFDLSGVDIEGAQETSVAAIERSVGYTGARVNIFTIDPELGRRRVEQLPWIQSATVTRVLPDRLRVKVVERLAAGIVMRDGVWLIDSEGSIFAPLDRDPDLDVPIISLPGVTRGREQTAAEKRRIQEALRIAALYQKRGLDAWTRLAEVEIDPIAGYVLITEKHRLRILLGEGRMEARLIRLEDVYRALERKEIVDARVVRLDGDGALRYVAVRTDRPRIGQ
jgi:cell division protein FtsQ